jgi:Bacterial pre-peptidase C-terminal domain
MLETTSIATRLAALNSTGSTFSSSTPAPLTDPVARLTDPLAVSSSFSSSNIGNLNGRQKYSGTVAGNRSANVYDFTLTTTTTLSATLSGIGGDADIYLYQAGSAIPLRASLSSSNQESFTIAGLNPGAYYVEVVQFGSSSTSYNLTLTADAAGNSLATARNLGALNTSSLRDFVGSDDLQDLYRFQLTGDSNNLTVTLSNLTADADLYLIRDANDNGTIDFGETLASSFRGGSADDSINLQNLAAGTYYLQVVQFTGNTNYLLNATAVTVTSPSASLAIPLDLSDLVDLSGQSSITGAVDNTTNPYDFYRFDLTITSDLNLTLIGFGGDADLYLARDFNDNGQIDSNELISYSGSLTSQESINANGLTAGTYYAIVAQFGLGPTFYSLTATADRAGNTFDDPNPSAGMTPSFNLDFFSDQIG